MLNLNGGIGSNNTAKMADGWVLVLMWGDILATVWEKFLFLTTKAQQFPSTSVTAYPATPGNMHKGLASHYGRAH